MKKFLLLSLTCLSTVSLAHAQSTESVMDFAQKLLLPDQDVFVDGQKPTLSETTGGYAIRVPAFKSMGNDVPAYTLNLDKVDGKAGVYHVLISDINQYKDLGSFLKDLNVTTSSFEYKVDMDVQKNIVPYQLFLMKDIVFKSLNNQEAEKAQIKSVSVETNASFSDKGAFWNKADIVVSAPEVISPLFTFRAKDLIATTEGEILKFPFDDTNDITNLGDLKVSLKMDGVSASSFLLPLSVLNVDLALNANMKESQTTNDATLDLKVHLDNIQIKTDVEKLSKYVPQSVDSNWTTTGFTYAKLNDLSKAQKALVQFSEQDVPEAAREKLRKALEANLEAKRSAFADNLKIKLSNIVSSDNYNIDLSGDFDAKAENFVGTLTITNFDYLAPAPKMVSPELCEAAQEKLTEIYMNNNGNMNNAEISKALANVQNACDEGQGPLDALREYLPTAQKSKNEKGQDVVRFDLKLQDGVFSINGKPIDSTEY